MARFAADVSDAEVDKLIEIDNLLLYYNKTRCPC